MEIILLRAPRKLQQSSSRCALLCLRGYYTISFHRFLAGSAQFTAKLGKSKIFPARVARCGIRKGEVLEMRYVFPHFPFPDSLLCLREHYTMSFENMEYIFCKFPFFSTKDRSVLCESPAEHAPDCNLSPFLLFHSLFFYPDTYFAAAASSSGSPAYSTFSMIGVRIEDTIISKITAVK